MGEESLQHYRNVFFNLGDCLFEDNSHHGTPSQRIVALEWGYMLAKEPNEKGRILPSLELAKLFDAEFENILE